MRRFILTTTYHDYEAHTNEGDRVDRRVRLKVWANSYHQAVTSMNRWIKQRNSQFNGYDYIPHRRG